MCSQGAGALAILVMAFTAGLGWRSQGWGDDNPVSAHLASLWIVFQPLLFSLIGAEIQVIRMSLIGHHCIHLYLPLLLKPYSLSHRGRIKMSACA